MSNPEIALFIEKEHLRDAEESDYMLMENLIQRRYDEGEEDAENAQQPTSVFLNVVHESKEFRNSYGNRLRRSSAIEDDIPTAQLPLGILIPQAESITVESYDLLTISASRVGDSPQTSRQDSGESSDAAPLIVHSSAGKPSIVIDSSQLPIQRDVVRQSDSKGSLHMQSETMC